MKIKTEKINFWEYYSHFTKRNKTYIKKKFGEKFQLKKYSVSSIFFRKSINFEECNYLAELIQIPIEELTFDKPIKQED